MHRHFLAIIPLVLLACQAEPVPCTEDEDCDDGTFCYLQPRGPNDPEAPEGMDPHQAKYQDEGICRQDCLSDQDCHGTYRCTNRGLCKDLDNAAENRQYTPEDEPDPLSLRQAFETDKLLSCRAYIGCVTSCAGPPEICAQECSMRSDPIVRQQRGRIEECWDNSCADVEADEQAVVDCLAENCPDVLDDCGAT